MSAIKDYLNLGLHKGLEGCIFYNDSKWDPMVFKRYAANLSGNVVVKDNKAYITDYPTTSNTVWLLEIHMASLCDELNVAFKCEKKMCVVYPR